MLCDGSPDPLHESELNTYMNLWREEVHYKSVPVVLEEIEESLKVQFHRECQPVLWPEVCEHNSEALWVFCDQTKLCIYLSDLQGDKVKRNCLLLTVHPSVIFSQEY